MRRDLLAVAILVVGWLLVTSGVSSATGNSWWWLISIGALLVGAGVLLALSSLGDAIDNRKKGSGR